MIHSFLLIGQSNTAGRGDLAEVTAMDTAHIKVLRKTQKIPILFLLLSLLLYGCSSTTETPPDQDTIAVSGSIAYYAAMDDTGRKDLLLNQRIEISGTVSSGGFTTLFVGDQKKDGICFSCTFPAHIEALETVHTGDNVQLSGICTSIIGDCIYLDNCRLSELPQAQPTTDHPNTTVPAASTTAPPAVPPTTAPVTAPTVPAATVPATTPTVPPATVPVTTPSAATPDSVTLHFIKWPETISRNETGEVTIQGKPNTEYAITVYYKSGPSTAKGLEAKSSDSSGYVTWTWKIGGKTSPGTFRIVVSGGGEQQSVHFTVKTQ